MGILSIVVILFSLVQLAVAWANRTGNRELPPAPENLLTRVSVLIPARNEADNLPRLLGDLLRLNTQPLEIIVCDDRSTDTTLRVARTLAAPHKHIRVFENDPLPAGWLGKNFACHRLARKAQGDFLLFLDADVRIEGTVLQRTVARMQTRRLGLLSVFPRQIMVSAGEKATVPLMTYILLTLLPLPLVYRVSGQSALAAANGQYMLFDTKIYRRLQPHEKVRRQAAEDIAISRYYKTEGIRVDCVTGIEGIACRMYRSYHTAIRGFARNIAAFFGGSLLLAFLFWLLTTWGWIPVWLYLSWPGFTAYLLLRVSIRILVSLTCRQPVTGNLIRAIPQQISMLLIILQAFRDYRNGRQEWKGRNILQ